MKIVLASYGTRGDLEPCLAVGRELIRRGHDVCAAVPPDMRELAAAAEVKSQSYGLATRDWVDAYRGFWDCYHGEFWRIRKLQRLWREMRNAVAQCWEIGCPTLKSLADGADLVITTIPLEQIAANVAEFYDTPLVTLHYAPARINGGQHPVLPSSIYRAAMTASEWMWWRLDKKWEDAQRSDLGLPKARTTTQRRIADRGSLEIQTYEDFCFPGLAAEWTRFDGRRPFVGPLTLGLPAESDDEVASWIADGQAPICFALGSIPSESPSALYERITTACAEIGERALICSGGTDLSAAPQSHEVKVVRAMNYGRIFPMCRAIAHNGGSGTTAASLRAGVPQLVLWSLHDQPWWGAVVQRFKVGTTRRLTATTQESLVADLRQILTVDCARQARDIGARMHTPAESVMGASDVVESFMFHRST